MSPRAAAWLAWSLWVVFVALQMVTIWQVWIGPAPSDAAFGVMMIGFATVGALVAVRRPGNAVGWLLLAIALAFAVQAMGAVYVMSPSNPGYLAVAWFSAWSWYVWMTLAAVFLPLVFPDGRLLSRRWRPVAWLGAAALAASVVGAAFAPGRLDLEVAVSNPLGVAGAAAGVVRATAVLGDVLALFAFLLAAASLVQRFRNARGKQRQQLKWFALVGLLTLGGLVPAIVAVLFPGGWRNPVGVVGYFTFLFTIILGVPAATGIAILRHRLYDIDLVIRRTLVYGALTALLVATYLGSVLLFRLVLSPVTGDSDLAVAASTLAVAALFRPARFRIQSVVDRRFYRARYDAGRTLEGFAVRLRDELDLDALGTDLRRVVTDTMQPAHVSLWLRGAP